ncbi:MAG: imelysin family protein [Anaerolineae bacterium]
MLTKLTRLMIWVVLALTVGLLPLYAGHAQSEEPDLSAISTYLLEHLESLKENTTLLVEAATRYYDLAEAAGFDYAALWETEQSEVSDAVLAAKDAWTAASPLYEQVEGIVAGVPTLSEYDVILDAGASGEEDPEGGVPFDLTLRDGRVLERPGNLFGLLEGTLWATRAEFSTGITADLDGDGELQFGEALPEANALLAMAETMDSYVDELLTAGQEWEPNLTDAFTALVVMTPTMSEYFGSWKASRFVMGDESEQTDFVVISRLSDIQDILGGLIVIYDNVSPLVAEADADLHEQIETGLADLLEYVQNIYQEEQDGRVFTAEEADFFGSEAQDRAMTIAGQITQAAALLNITLPE